MTRAELRRILGVFLVDEWLKEVGWTDADLDRFLTDGIPADWAEMIAKTIPVWPVSIWPKLLHAPRVLTNRSPKVKVNVNQMMPDKHRVAISDGRSYKTKFQQACIAAQTTQGKVAKAIGVSPAFLSMCARGTKALSLDKRQKVERLVGWPVADWKKTSD